MAAPFGKMASRCLVQYLSCFGKNTLGHPQFRHLSSSINCRSKLKTKILTEKSSAPWTLMAAVCVQRLPVISSDCSPLEQRFTQLMQQMELENSLLSDHELRLLEDAERLRRKQTDDYDSDEEDGQRDQEIVLAQDLEDTWEQKLKNFQPVPRVKGDVDKDLTSVGRCLAESLFLLAEQQVGAEKLWLLPQTRWQEGETLRQTAERALDSLPEADFKATFLSNAPCGVYKFKLPPAARSESSVGIKLFFFKAVLSDSGATATSDSSFMWLRKDELQRYLKPAYMMKVERFILNL